MIEVLVMGLVLIGAFGWMIWLTVIDLRESKRDLKRFDEGHQHSCARLAAMIRAEAGRCTCARSPYGVSDWSQPARLCPKHSREVTP